MKNLLFLFLLVSGVVHAQRLNKAQQSKILIELSKDLKDVRTQISNQSIKIVFLEAEIAKLKTTIDQQTREIQQLKIISNNSIQEKNETAYPTQNYSVTPTTTNSNKSYSSGQKSTNQASSESSETYQPRGYDSPQTIYTGPRGGRYYINKNGNKTYIRRK